MPVPSWFAGTFCGVLLRASGEYFSAYIISPGRRLERDFFVLPLPQALGALFSEGLRAEGGGRRQKKTGRKCGERREAPKNYLGHQVHASLSLAVYPIQRPT